MKIKMRTLACGVDWTYQPGQIVDVPVSMSNDLIAGGYAEAVKDAPKVEAKVPVEEKKPKKEPEKGKK